MLCPAHNGQGRADYQDDTFEPNSSLNEVDGHQTLAAESHGVRHVHGWLCGNRPTRHSHQ